MVWLPLQQETLPARSLIARAHNGSLRPGRSTINNSPTPAFPSFRRVQKNDHFKQLQPSGFEAAGRSLASKTQSNNGRVHPGFCWQTYLPVDN
jgi:hypothetical protein